MGIAYEAAFRACTGLVAAEGYRLKSVPGHHRGGIEAAAAVLPPDAITVLRRIDSARRFRNQSLYDAARPVSAAELDQLLIDAQNLVDRLARLLTDVIE